MRALFSDNLDYIRYEQGLKNLHDLLARGQNDSREAEAIHNAMDEVEPRLTGAEIDRLNGLSADLYMLSGNEMPEAPIRGVDGAGLVELIQNAWDRGHLDEVLRLLRKQPRALSEDRIAHPRACAYARLGHPETAGRFFEYAYHANPTNSEYRYHYLASLITVNRIAEARDLAVEWLGAPPMAA